MTRRIIFGILIALVLIGGAIGVGVTTYRIGYVQGLEQSGKIEFVLPPRAGDGDQVAPDGVGPRGMPWGYYGGPGFYRPYGFGGWGWGGGPFGFIGCLFPLLFFFLIFGLFRGLFWRPWGWGHRGGWGPGGGKGAPPMFEEWHKRAHGETPPAPSASSETPTTQA